MPVAPWGVAEKTEFFRPWRFQERDEYMPAIFTNEGIRRLVFGQGAAARLGEELTLLGAKQVLVVLDPALAGSEAVTPALDSLEAAGVSFNTFSGFTREPEPAEADAAAALGKKIEAQAVVGIGGGSAMDPGQGRGRADHQPPARATDYVGLDLVKEPGVPVICLPTTARHRQRGDLHRRVHPALGQVQGRHQRQPAVSPRGHFGPLAHRELPALRHGHHRHGRPDPRHGGLHQPGGHAP